MNPDSDRLLAGYKQLANVVILVSLPIAGCSRAVAVAAGLADRRRSFSLLRLTGVPLAMLRRVVALETVVPLVLTAAASIAIGVLAAALFLRAYLDQTLVAPGPPVLPDRCRRARRRAGDSRLDLADDVADHRPGSVPLRLTPGTRR